MPKKVTLILGAGSSCMYGAPERKLPTAEGLTNLLTNTARGYSIFKLPPHEQYLAGDLQSRRVEICDIFAKSGNYSIDRFLERRNEFEDEGKLIIADCLLPLELGAIQSTSLSRDWYQWLFHHLYIPSKKCLHTTNLSIITFNYDRTLEFAMRTMLMHNTAKSHQEVEALVASLDINHVYGTLQSPFNYDHSKRNWRSNPSSIDVTASAKAIHIISNGREERGARSLASAQKSVSEADVLVLLGFGFDKENMQRIGLHSAPKTFTLSEIGQLDIYASAFHVDERDSMDARNYLLQATVASKGKTTRAVKVTMGEYEHGCEKFLRRNVSLRTLLEVPD